MAVFPSSTPNLFRQLLKHLIEQRGSGPLNKSDSLEVLPADPEMSKKGRDMVINEKKASPMTKKIPKKRRKVDDMVEGGYIKVTALPTVTKCDSGGTESLLHSDLSASFKEECWQCKSCERSFQSEQGVKTHVYMMHVLDGGDAVVHDSIMGNVPHPLICTICSRVCPNNDALQQHTVAKHSGQFQDIKPSWAMETVIEAHAKNIEHDPNSSSPLDTSYECLICSFTFPTSEQLESHLQGWQPLNVTDQLSCEYCQHCFKDERALKQHINHCKRVPTLQLSSRSDIKI
jgi:C2H2 type zinc-finger (2 copies)